MRRRSHAHSCWTACFNVVATCAAVGSVLAQPPERLATIQAPLAEGVLTVIPPQSDPEESFSGPRAIPEIIHGIPNLDWDSNLFPKSRTLQEMAKQVVFRRPVWNLEFAFKPVRMLEVDVPQPSGKMQRKLIWYMVYRVKNKGQALAPMPLSGNEPNGPHETQPFAPQTLRFFPHFVLASQDYGKEYLDRVIPAAQRAIQLREGRGEPLLNSIEISRTPIQLSDDRTDRSVWGVATWEDVDPRIDYFSVYIRGLTNAFRFDDPEGAYKPNDPPATGRTFTYKTLQLNFWRPGDVTDEDEREIRFGIPVDNDPEVQQRLLDHFEVPERLDYRWLYR